MKSEVLLSYRKENGYIDYDKFIEENPEIKQSSEDRGTPKRNKIWLRFEDVDILARDESLDEDGVLYTGIQELIFEELSKQVKFPCAHYDIGIRGEKCCVFSENILKNQTHLEMVSLRDLLDATETKQDYDHSFDISDAFRAMANHCKCMNIDDETQESVMKDFAKMQVLDTFLSSTDRHAENISFLTGLDKATGKPIFRLSPLYDNELSCGSEEPQEKMQTCLDNYTEAVLTASMQSPCGMAPEEAEHETQKRVRVAVKDPSSAVLQFCMGLDEEVEDFAGDCQDKLNIPLAIKAVEARTGIEIPQEYKEFLINNYMCRKPLMVNAINEFYEDPSVGGII